MWFFVTLVFSFFKLFPATEICPSVCRTCFAISLSCTDGGLKEIPKDLHFDTKQVTLIGHNFSQTSLSRQNFSRFSRPNYSIEQLSIRKSNIDTVKFNTFYDLSGLDALDLSENAVLNIEDRAFANLKLKHLGIDQIGSLNLAPTAFFELMVASLSIKNSGLSTFPFSSLEPLSKELRNLFLSKNNLRSISSKFEALFRQLTVLDLQGNPLICSCGLLWLGVTLRWREQHINSQSGSFTVHQNPRCAAPSYLKGEYVNSVAETEFNCQAPKLERIEIQFQNFQNAVLRCAGKTQARRAPVNISWTYINDYGSFHPRAIQPLHIHESAISINRRETLDRFVCSMVTESGNLSVKVHLNWPNENIIRTSLNFSRYQNPSNSNIPRKSSDYHQNIFFGEQYTLLELLGSIVGTFLVTMFVFIVIYRLHFYKAIKLKKEQLKKCGYNSYEVGLYSDSQTYDIPHIEYRNTMFNPVLTMQHP